MSQLSKILKGERYKSLMSKYGIGIILFIMMIFIGIMEPSFRSKTNFLNVTTQVSINAMISFGMCLVITTGGIDLSVGAQLAWVSCVLGQLITVHNINPVVAIVLALVAATVWGFINGVLIAKFNMFPFVVTLSTQLIIRGLAQLVSGGKSVALADRFLQKLYNNKLGPLPLPIVIFIVVTILVYMLLHWTKFGRYVFAVGGNVNAAISSGISEFWVKTLVYTMSGFLAGVAGVIMTGKTGSAQSNIGVGYETDAVAACVIGGTSFAGGVATIPGVVMGIFIIGFIYNGMNLIGVESYYQSITKGVVIILAVLSDLLMNKKNK